MQAIAWCSAGDDRRVALGHGDLIGRLGAAALALDDARISEAHAMLSLRRGALYLLALRGRFRVSGQPRAEVELAEGMVVELAEGLNLTVHAVELPDNLLGVEAEGLPAQALSGATSLLLKPAPHLRPGWLPEADAWLWNIDSDWRIQVRGGPPEPFWPGASVRVGPIVLRAVPISLRAASVPRTQRDLAPSLHISACVSTVQVKVGGEQPVVIGGLPGRMLAEIVAIDGPVSWDVVAKELWRDHDLAALRRRWDVSLSRLRAKLRGIGARDDLIVADGAGQVELVLREGDTVTLRDA